MAKKTLKTECRKCKELLTEDMFYVSSFAKRDFMCKKCQIEKQKIYQKKNREQVNESHKKYAFLNPEKVRGYQQKYRNTHKDRLLVGEKAKRDAIRYEVLSFYSDNKIECACCGENHIEFLAIDHIDGGGREHRKEVGSHTYEWLIRNDFPEGFRVLCHNCNMSLGFYGYCPHE